MVEVVSPKDVKALIKTSKEHDYEPELLSSVENVNSRQKMVLVHSITEVLGEDLSDKKTCNLGTGF